MSAAFDRTKAIAGKCKFPLEWCQVSVTAKFCSTTLDNMRPRIESWRLRVCHMLLFLKILLVAFAAHAVAAPFALASDSFNLRRRYEAAGDGYFVGRVSALRDCEDRCRRDIRCNMFEYYVTRHRCSLFEQARPGGYSPNTTIGLRVGSPTPIAQPPLAGRPEATVATPVNLELEIEYRERIGVPKGSMLDVVVRDRTGRALVALSSPTTTAYPPYFLRVPIKDTTFPLQLETALRSRAGHRFGQTTDIADATAAAKPQRITLQMK